MSEPRGWHSRGYLPYYDDGASIQTISYRLADSLPAEVLAKMEEQALDDDLRRIAFEHYLDAGHGSCLLREPRNASIVIDGWHHFEGIRYRLHAWVVMPNHVHVLIAPLANHALSAIMQSEKSFTAKAILTGSAGLRPAPIANETPALPKRHLWQPDYYDRFIRNETHYAAAVNYIHQDPVKAGLVERAEDWLWSSAREWERGRLARL